MSKRIEILNSFYDDIDEDSRLNRGRHGQLEYLTTMDYIHRYAKAGANILEIGAGTGNILELAEGITDFKMPDSGFDLFVKYHLATCEKRELLGSSSHLFVRRV